MDFYGIRGTCHSLIKSYLSDRVQTTKFQSVESDECAIEYGVPQGSVLGPLLFLIYINDIVNLSPLDTFVLFADDTNIFISGSSEREAYEKSQIVLNKIEEYMFANQLHINIEKTCYMYFRYDLSNLERMTCARSKTIDNFYSLRLYDEKIKRVSKTKFLGVVIDENLNWKAHLEHLEEKLKLSIVMIKRIKKFIPKTEYLKVYHALFLSHLCYCITVWGNIPSYRLEKLFSLQKRCIRLLFGTHYTYDHPEFYQTCARVRTFQQHKAPKNYVLEHTKPIFNEHNILSLHNLYQYHSFVEVFKLLKYNSPTPVYNLFLKSQRDNKLSLIMPIVQLNKTKENLVFSASENWNNLLEFIFEKCEPETSGIAKGLIIPGSCINSDLTASTSFVKSTLKQHLLSKQKSGSETIWS